ncbi:hypothetical protein [Thioclava sp. GXIMD4215]|uniref:hypothetical protein n=1 Tax=Thioclava sp. GXIMD4215 TaxID=3131928 RepID=UPI003255C28D
MLRRIFSRSSALTMPSGEAASVNSSTDFSRALRWVSLSGPAIRKRMPVGLRVIGSGRSSHAPFS